MAKPVHTSDTMDKLRGVLSSGPHKGQAIDAALNIVRKKREAGGSANDPTMRNPVGWSSIYPAQIMSNASPSFRPLSDAKLPGAERPLFADEVEGARKYSLRLFEDASNAAGLMGSTGTKAPVMLASARKSGLPLPPYPAGRGAPANVDATPPVQGIRAFHGSPHTFDRFDMSKLGTGEGAQAYGHGLYFAGNEGVARSYRDQLTNRMPHHIETKLIENGVSPNVANTYARWAAETQGGRGSVDAFLEMMQRPAPSPTIAEFRQKMLAEGDALRAAAAKVNGSMYEVNLRTSPERLLDWDKPLSAQPAGVRQALAKVGVSGEVPKPFNGMPLGNGGKLRIVEDVDFGPRMFMDLAQGGSFRINESDLANLIGRQGGEMFGKTAYTSAATKAGGDLSATEAMRKSGIDGIQYLDAGSRGAGEGSRNYVMFDDKLIDILRRYGLIGMLGGGGAGVAAGEVERADGGAVEAAMRIVRKKRADGGAVGLHTGPIHSSVAGRTDHLPMHVHSGSYVIPADIVSAMGEGNTMAGFKQINAMFGEAGSGAARAEGGAAKPPVPIVAAGGEYVLSPEQVAKAGDGDVDMGHRVLDEWVKRMRAKTIKTLTKLPGPKKD